MKIPRWLALAALLASGSAASAQEPTPDQGPGARIWLDRGDEPLLQRGDRVRVYYRTDADAFVAIFHIDTDGAVTLLHPRAPEDESFTRGGRDYRLLFPQSSYWYVDEYPGKGYFFVVASPRPLDLGALDYAYQERRWDLTRAGQSVYRDPYLAMDDYVALLVPGWETTAYGLDFLAYDVGEVHEYPRFLCYDCHGYRSYATWNPYTYACSSFRVVVWDDPWFYPAVRYQGVRVAYAPPRRGVARFEFKERAPGEAWTPMNRTRRAVPRGGVEYVEPGAALPRSSAAPTAPRRTTGADPLERQGATPSAPSRQAAPSRQVPSTSREPVARPSAPAAAPRRDEPGAATSTPSPGERPTLQRRPSATAPSRPSAGGTGSPSRPSGGTTVRPPSEGRGSAVTRPSGGGTRVVTPPRTAPSAARPSSGSRPPASMRAPSSGSRPPSGAASGSRPSRASGARAAPPPSRKPRGGGG